MAWESCHADSNAERPACFGARGAFGDFVVALLFCGPAGAGFGLDADLGELFGGHYVSPCVIYVGPSGPQLNTREHVAESIRG